MNGSRTKHPTLIAGMRFRRAIDPSNNLVLWAFCTDPSRTYNDRILAYDYEIAPMVGVGSRYRTAILAAV